MKPDHPWLEESAPVRVTKVQRAADIARLVGVATLILFLLTLPGIVLAALMLTPAYVIALVLLTGFAAFYSWIRREPLEGTGVTTSFTFWGFLLGNIGLVLAGVLVVAAVMAAAIVAALWFYDITLGRIEVLGVLTGGIRDWGGR